MRDIDKAAIDLLIGSARYCYPVDRVRMSIVLAGLTDGDSSSGRDGTVEYARQLIRQGMKETLAYRTRVQREWQTMVSRRPQRGRHHDSWAIREKYVRAA